MFKLRRNTNKSETKGGVKRAPQKTHDPPPAVKPVARPKTTTKPAADKPTTGKSINRSTPAPKPASKGPTVMKVAEKVHTKGRK